MNKQNLIHVKTLDLCVGNTPLVELKRIQQDSNRYLVKMEGNNPAGSVKDRPALNMIQQAEVRGEIKPGDTLIEATSGNTGIALAMVAAMKGYQMILIMPDNMSEERRITMSVYGAEIILVSAEDGMEAARDLAIKLEVEGKGKVLDQFSNPDNSDAHYRTTGPEIWSETAGQITHFISSMGTTGTIMGVSKFLKQKQTKIRIVGVQPTEGSTIPGIRRWPDDYLPKIFDAKRVDQTIMVSQLTAESMAQKLASEEGIFCGISSGGAVAVMLQLGQQLEDATMVSIICDRGDRYLSTDVFGK